MQLIRLVTLLQLLSAACAQTPVSADSFSSLTRAPALLSKLEASLLALTGRTHRPAPSRNNSPGDSVEVPAHLQRLFETSHGNALETTNLHLPGRFTRHANTVRSFYPPHEDPILTPPAHLRFDLASIPDGELVTGAELHVTLNATGGGACKPRTPLRVTVYDMTKRPRAGEEPIMYAVDTVKPDTPEGILSLDVFPAVQRWLAKGGGKANHGLWLELKGAKACGISLTAPTLFTYSADAHSRRPRSAEALSRKYRSVTSSGAGRKGGGRRRGGHKHKGRKRNLCAKHKMFVDFTDVGWNDWIVAPPGYHAHHCAGECPFPMADHLNATNHAVIQALVNSMNPQLVPPPCCVPTKYSSLSLLYTDSSDKIVLKNYNEMVVDSCGCS